MSKRLVLAIVLMLVLAGCGGAPASQPATTAPDTTATEPAAASGGEEGQPAAPAEGGSSVRLTFAGSTTVQPLAEKLGAVYQQQNPGMELEIGAGGSRVGIEAVQQGNADIGMASRELKEDEQTPGMDVHQIAIDVLAIIVHPSNPVNDLSLEQLRGIYEGTITNWNEVGGPDVPIVPVIRELSSGTRGAFDEIVLDDGEPTASAVSQVTAGEVHTYVAETEGAIGYVGFGHIGGDEVQVLSIDSVVPSPDSAVDRSYRLKRPLQLLTGPLSRPEAMGFVEFALSDEGQQIVADDGWVPVKKSAMDE